MTPNIASPPGPALEVHDQHIKQEQDDSLFVQSGGYPSKEPAHQDGKEKEMEPVTFSKQDYIAAMAEDLGLDELREKDLQQYIRTAAIIRAEWDTYKAVRLSKGHVEVS